MSKVHQICPTCFSTRIHVKLGGGGYTENGVFRIPDDFGEVYECPDCRFQGVGIVEGNSKLVDFLFKKKADLKRASIARKQAVEIPEIQASNASKPLMVLDVQAKLV